MSNWRLDSDSDKPVIYQYHRPRLTALAVLLLGIGFAVLVVLSTVPMPQG